MTDLETRLRATLADRANNAPPGGPLAERILAETSSPIPVLRPRHGWRTWTMPLLAAAAVAGVVAAVVGIAHLASTASPKPPAVSPIVSPAPRPTNGYTPSPHPSHSIHPVQVVPPPPIDPNGVTGFRAGDLTFVSDTDGWALGSANCVSGKGRCTALYRTTNGRTWTSMPGATFNVPGANGVCTAPCVEHIRFANTRVGYAYSPSALFLTQDGGQHWSRQAGGGALALETFNGNVIRVVSDGTGCPGPCNIRVETSAIGSTSWQPVQLGSSTIDSAGLQFARGGSNAYILAMRNPAGGGEDETSTLYVSTDNGASWTERAEPCPQNNRAGKSGRSSSAEVDSVAVAAAPDGRVSVLCAPRQGGSPMFAAVSHDSGARFTREAGTVPEWLPAQFTGDPQTVLVAGGAGIGAYRSTDSGATWQRMADLGRDVSFLGFEDSTVGRAITDGGRAIWTTHDGGRSWTPFRFR